MSYLLFLLGFIAGFFSVLMFVVIAGIITYRQREKIVPKMMTAMMQRASKKAMSRGGKR